MQNFYKNKLILVTGGAGFIGSHLVEKLISYKAKVIVLDNLSTGNLNNLNNIKNKYKFINLDIRDIKLLTNFFKEYKNKINYIFHLAAATSVPESMTDSQLYYDINLTGTVNLLELTKNYNSQAKFIFSSSAAVYGPKDNLCSESDSCEPSSIYGLTKLMGEVYLRNYSKFYNLKTLSLRYFNLYGPRQDHTSNYAGAYAKFKYNLEHNLAINIYGSGEQVRDFVPVNKVVDSNLSLALLEDKDLNGQPVNIASGEQIKIIELLNKLKLNYPKYNSKNITFKPARSGDIEFSGANIKKLNNFLS